jgi:hypothetical protein
MKSQRRPTTSIFHKILFSLIEVIYLDYVIMCSVFIFFLFFSPSFLLEYQSICCFHSIFIFQVSSSSYDWPFLPRDEQILPSTFSCNHEEENSDSSCRDDEANDIFYDVELGRHISSSARGGKMETVDICVHSDIFTKRVNLDNNFDDDGYDDPHDCSNIASKKRDTAVRLEEGCNNGCDDNCSCCWMMSVAVDQEEEEKEGEGNVSIGEFIC